MTRILRYIAVVATVCVGLAGCGGSHDIDARLALVNDLANAGEADSAIALLQSIEKTSLNEYNSRYLDLMDIKTRDKADADITGDTAIVDIMEYFDDEGPDEVRGEAYYYGGRVYREMGDAPQALDYYQKAQDAYPQDQTFMKGKIASQMGQIFLELYMFDHAKTKFQEAIHHQKECKDSVGLMYNFCNLREVYQWLNCYDSVIPNYDKSLKIATELKNKGYQQNIFFRKIDYYFTTGDLEKAKLEFNSANYSSKNISDFELMVAINFFLSEEKYDKAKKYSIKLKNSNSIYSQKFAYSTLADIAKYKNSLDIYKYTIKYKSCIDSIDKYASRNAVIHQNSFYNYALREKENLLLIGYKDKTKYLYVLSMLSLIVIALILYSYYSYRKETKLLSLIQEDKIKKIEAELQKLEKNQISDLVQTVKISDEIRSEYIKLIEIKAPNEYILPEEIITSDIYIKLKSAIKNTDIHINEKDWVELEKIAVLCYPKFKTTLTILYSSISDYEYRICLLTKLKFGKKEIADLTYHSPSSVTNTRSRLYEKMFLKKGTASDMDYLISLL